MAPSCTRRSDRLVLAPMSQPPDLVVLGLLDLGLFSQFAAVLALVEELDLLQVFDCFSKCILRTLELSRMSAAEARRLSRRAIAALAKVE